MKLIKIKTIEISTNGCLIFFYANPSKLIQVKTHVKDYKNLSFTQKQKKNIKTVFSKNFYKKKYKF